MLDSHTIPEIVYVWRVRVMHLLATTHLLVTAAMVGVIWLVQLTHYPSFRYIDPAQFQRFEKFHSASISFVVMPLMLLELATAALLCNYGERAVSFIASLLLLALIWLSTFAVQVPIHQRLEKGYDLASIDRLIATNWIRTLCWSGRFLLLLVPTIPQ